MRGVPRLGQMAQTGEVQGCPTVLVDAVVALGWGQGSFAVRAFLLGHQRWRGYLKRSRGRKALYLLAIFVLTVCDDVLCGKVLWTVCGVVGGGAGQGDGRVGEQ